MSESNPAVPSWDEHADWWINGFTGGVDPEYEEQIIPLVIAELGDAQRILDVGCGEGQISRRLAALGKHRLVVGLDPTERHIEVARARGGNVDYRVGVVDDLPFADGTFDAVVACLVFEHVDNVDRAIREVSRVLEPGGTFLFLLNHPLLQTPNSGWIDDQILDPPEQYWRIGEYLTEAVNVEEVEPGIRVRFVHRPLGRYLNALAEAGLFLERMHEPAPPPGFLARCEEYALASTIPRLLALRLRRLRDPSTPRG
ncbi:MAG: class I SAM-dependent methyltransferase [Actinomycetota bacterium]